MKKCLALLAMVVSMTACKQAAEEQKQGFVTTAASPEADEPCINLDDYNKETTVEDKAKWLREYGKTVCQDTLFPAIIKDHAVSAADITFSSSDSFNIKWKDLDFFLDKNYYNGYLSFDIDKEEVKAIKLVPKFTTNYPCYSVPFFRAIADENELEEDSEIEFKFGKIATKDRVIVIVNNPMGIAYYDFSNDPK